jgi:hypothetical protein
MMAATSQRVRVRGVHCPDDGLKRGAGLIMTATLVPPVSAVARSDPAERLRDYLDALAFYLTLPAKTIDRILLVDNSAADIGPIVELARKSAHDKHVEVISFAGNDHSPARGKAWGEFKLMDYGLANTTLFGPEDIVWKTTGRLKFLNLPETARMLAGGDYDLVCDLHNVPWVGSGAWRDNRYMDLRVFTFRLKVYDAVFRNTWQERLDGYDAKFMYGLALAARENYRVIPRFPLQPRLQGVSGRHLRDYGAGSQRMKDDVRGVLRRVAPWFWV